ncbi:Protein of unknown function (DUF2867) [Nocardia amikacinitolerans]|uniref:DUF2867 domain-containing protein n=1 Tax=Nocardia amikacinitolerans TaxID=756689 RepID=UPI000832B76A|nr:DUF2867 domain-containing protein [Nocardia amikacinitolerans]MCP2320351.1 Protein of unknown function (DUF2867) [Nocardia amikacinitolerans]
MTTPFPVPTARPGRKIPDEEHTERPWRIHEIAPDFALYDVWALPTPGGPDDLPRLIRLITTDDDTPQPLVFRALFEIRWKLGALLGWDDTDSGVGARVTSLRERLPDDLRAGPHGPDVEGFPFTSVYLTENEWAAEMANRTVHTVMHIGWVRDGSGYRGQMAVLVKPNGLFGKVYMAAIAPFRYTLVYPALMRILEQGWQRQAV